MTDFPRKAFTLIELLVVVAIIAILAAIAVPNFMEATTRSKVSRVRADMRSVACAVESYRADTNAYPPGYKTAPIHSLNALTTPIAFMTSADLLDPFRPSNIPMGQRQLSYELAGPTGLVIQSPGGPYAIDPATDAGDLSRGVGWWIVSRGPDKEFGFRPFNLEYDLLKRYYESDIAPEPFMDTLYDPTNGTNSTGNLYRAGGSPVNQAMRLMAR
ncbi:MAG TPA: prepilin-type N-terminal cleavage/methylation domain-containing protein [Candidatus Sumerlaeota bacterium]|nr:prepilin-type N-terminal cleavage/methylation domain-containing protein [Candidatus Sumerlaeota bacterium]